MDRWIAGFLQAGAAVLFVVAGASADEVTLILFGLPALGSGVAGLLLWSRSTRDPIGATRMARVPGGEREGVEELLRALQEDVARLREDREFYRELYGGPSRRLGDLPET